MKPELTTSPCRVKVPMKLENAEDSLEEEYGPLRKRSKVSSALEKLRKSPSLLDLIQMRLSQGNGSNVGAPEDTNASSAVKNETKSSASAPSTNEKLKASNFTASLLRIGHWEYKSRHEGDLVAKCYFAKHKLVWEVLDGGLKCKIEIQWSDIMGLKANCPEDAPGTLIVVLARQPLFFRETNPQPRKHTLWQTTTDFTNGQASIHRQHFMQCPQGQMNKHFEKLIQCDHRLYHLSQQSEIIMNSTYFESRPSIFEDPEESKSHCFGPFELGIGPSVSSSLNLVSAVAAQSSSEHLSQEAPSTSSVTDTRLIEGAKSAQVVDSRGPRNWDQMEVPGLHQSMSMSDLMNHLEQRLFEEINSGNHTSEDALQCQVILKDIAQYLLTDTQVTAASDETSLMSRVNSLCCLLQIDNASVTNSLAGLDSFDGGRTCGNSFQQSNQIEMMPGKDPEIDAIGGSSGKTGMSRKDSFGELLLSLPRIASLPKCLFNISEEDSDSN